MSQEIYYGFVVRKAWCYGCQWQFTKDRQIPRPLKEDLLREMQEIHDTDVQYTVEVTEGRQGCSGRKLAVAYDNAMCEFELVASGAPDKKEVAPIGTASEGQLVWLIRYSQDIRTD